jgi:hypothetical protein
MAAPTIRIAQKEQMNQAVANPKFRPAAGRKQATARAPQREKQNLSDI